jgi:hypothetical protein
MRPLLIALFCAACTPSFASPSDVFDLRVLAVQAEPPEAQFDDTSAQDVQLRVLVVDPAPGRSGASAVLSWQLCAPTDSRRCDNGVLLHGEQSRQGVAFPATTITVPADLVQAARAGDKLGGFGGIRVMFAFSVDDGDPHGAVHADKTLLYTPAGTPPNHNPLMTGVDVTEDTQFVKKVDAGGTLDLKVGVERGLRPLLAAGAIEEYDVTDLRNNPVHLPEHPRYSFFTTQGAELDRDDADEPLNKVAPPDGLVRIKALRAGQGTLWIVVRDGRGGESWINLDWTAT